MRVFYTPRYYADIGEGHVFPIKKFEHVRDKLLAEGILHAEDVVAPEPASIDQALLVHTSDYITRLCEGRLTKNELRRLGLPWSPSLVERSFFATGGTISAAHAALEDGVGSNLAGGTHHSFPDHGAGFCVLNDVAIAINLLRREQLATRVAVVDCDVHQGDGTATIFESDPNVFTFSLHGAGNYPLFKARSTLDIELPDNTSDEAYLNHLVQTLPKIFRHQPDIIFYLAGADPFAEDKLGRLSLSINGLRRRDELVLDECYKNETPVVTVMSGGYAKNMSDTVEIHCNTIRVVRSIFSQHHSAALQLF